MAVYYVGEKADGVNVVLPSVTSLFVKWCGSNLKGLYLHGSLAMGCFRPWSSDIDLVAVVFEPMDRESKLGLVGDVMALAESGEEFKKFEFSIVVAKEALRAVHPIRYVLHYSNTWHDAYKGSKAELIIAGGEDEDLAAHFMVARQRGATLYGIPLDNAIGQVSREDYLQAVWYDIKGAEEEILKNSMCVVLNLCRTLMYLRTDLVGSKLEGGLWAAAMQEYEAYRNNIETAIKQYTSAVEVDYSIEGLQHLAKGMLAEIGSYLQ
jgi:hypothetical protein